MDMTNTNKPFQSLTRTNFFERELDCTKKNNPKGEEITRIPEPSLSKLKI